MSKLSILQNLENKKNPYTNKLFNLDQLESLLCFFDINVNVGGFMAKKAKPAEEQKKKQAYYSKKEKKAKEVKK